MLFFHGMHVRPVAATPERWPDRWTGVGRHTVWGNGEVVVVYDEES